MSVSHVIVEGPVGPMVLVSDGNHLTGLWIREPFAGIEIGPCHDLGDAPPVLRDAAHQLNEYFAGQRTEFDLPLAPRGTAFQQRVWQGLAQIPYAETRSYGQIAAAIGQPRAAQAVGAANGRNPISIIVPCHRVVASNGALTGYSGGMERKTFLLDLERSGARAGA